MKSFKVSAINFIGSVLANIDNELLTDNTFRKFIRNSLYVIEKPELENIINPEIKKRMEKYYPTMNKNEIKEITSDNNSTDISDNITLKTWVEHDILEIISELTNIDKDNIGDADSLEHDLGLDSLDLIDLVIEIEAHFNIEFEDDEIKVDNWTTIADILDRVKEKLKNNIKII